jgi:hypothetical protein
MASHLNTEVAAAVCACCGGLIGGHQLLWRELSGGMISVSIPGEEPGPGGEYPGRLWHAGCLPRELIRNTGTPVPARGDRAGAPTGRRNDPEQARRQGAPIREAA